MLNVPQCTHLRRVIDDEFPEVSREYRFDVDLVLEMQHHRVAPGAVAAHQGVHGVDVEDRAVQEDGQPVSHRHVGLHAGT